jgi:hypothetical protein
VAFVHPNAADGAKAAVEPTRGAAVEELVDHGSRG